MKNSLSNYFSGIGAKRLSAVEVSPNSSNQHEFNGINEFKNIFGTEKITFKGNFIFLSDNEEQVQEENGFLTWYDARENHATRTEFRFYYSSNLIHSSAAAGDLLLICRTGMNELVVIIAPESSTAEKQLLWLFGIEEVENKFIIKDLSEEKTELGFAGKYIVEKLGIEIQEDIPDYIDELLKQFGDRFPSTFEFSKYARSIVKHVSAFETPDETLVAWIDQETILFKTLEKYIVEKALKSGFGTSGIDVEAFIQFSLSVQNRRKSRAGFSFEHHLAYIFDCNQIQYSKGYKTERNNKPDFLFPGINYYRDFEFNVQLLTMLGVKTTAKDRWRQVLSEAERIEQKHLITLEPAISFNQTEEMIAQKVQLVIPQPLILTYTNEQQKNIINLSDFINVLREKQTRLLVS
jgi:hypothetical protein